MGEWPFTNESGMDVDVDVDVDSSHIANLVLSENTSLALSRDRGQL